MQFVILELRVEKSTRVQGRDAQTVALFLFVLVERTQRRAR
jgi:hypothetical protein